MREKCGVIGIRSYDGRNVVPMVINGLRTLQHRGQEAWGLAIPGHKPFKKMGLVTDSPYDASRAARELPSSSAIGHVRYSTVGGLGVAAAQPLEIGSTFSIAHNGTVYNVEEFYELVKSDSPSPNWVSDTDLAGIRLLQHVRRFGGDWARAFEDLSMEVSGSFSFVIVTNDGDVLAARDPRGFRPLCLGWDENTSSYIVASESCAISALGGSLMRDVHPGELITIGDDGLESSIFAKSGSPSHCAFEYTYFAHPSSTLEGRGVYMARKGMGRALASQYGIKGEVVVPVPDSARPAALGFSEASGIPMEEGLMKDRYSRKGRWRSFIEPLSSERRRISRWVISVPETVREKHVVVIDDSIVRGTSARRTVRALRAAGAKRVSLLVTFPPVLYPCYAGIDFPTRKELFAFKVCGRTDDLEGINKSVAKAVGADFLGYNSPSSLCQGIGMPPSELCLSCVSGDYSCLRTRPEFREMKKKKV